jgi:RNA polymerase sigma-70 factor (ECF subfamily)
MNTIHAAALDLESVGEPPRAAALPSTFAAIYERHKDAVYRLALRYGSRREAWAEDVVQDVFVSALGSRSFPETEHEAGAWLYRATTNRCLTRLRREQLFERIVGAIKHVPRSERRSPELECGASQALGRVAGWFDQLPAKEKVAFAMRVYDDKSQVEIAATMGHSTVYISKLIQRAESKLKTVLESSDE